MPVIPALVSMVAQACNPSAWEVAVGGSGVQDLPEFHEIRHKEKKEREIEEERMEEGRREGGKKRERRKEGKRTMGREEKYLHK